MAIYLVTGGAGFIGSNIVEELVRRRQNVVVIDNLSTGKKDNLASVIDKIKFIEGDIRDLSLLQEACKGVDYVLHQAALRAVERSVDNPTETNEVNITGTLNVLMAARDAKVKRVVLASSSSVYGSIKSERNVETLPLTPESPYALSKLTDEHYARLFYKLYGLPTVSLRYFNVFGPHQNPESKYSAVIPILVSQLMSDATPEIHWHGRQSRDFTYIANVVQANIKAATSRNVKLGEAYNIGNGENTCINDLYKQLQELLGIFKKPNRTSKRPGDVLKTYADIRRAKKDLGYKPTVTFKQGLAKSIKWYKTVLA